MNKINKGFTLFEVLISLSILGTVSIFGLQKLSDEIDKNNIYNFVKNINDVVNAVDSRISIDGYDPDLWESLSWSDESEIINNLVGEDLQSINSKCPNGKWNPKLNAESETSLLPCNFNFGNSKFDMSSKIINDSAGFIQKFEIVFNFKNNDFFQNNLIDLRSAMRDIDTYEKRENSGMHSMYFVSKLDTNKEITSFECINDISNCSFKASYDRSGGNEYIRADGSNSVIGEHLTFIESKGDSPMKCIRWANTDRAGTGTWSQTVDEDCGIGIYKNDPHPVMLDVVADTGTFKNILLDKECKLYAWDSSSVVDTGSLSPCGINATSGDVYQVVDNISAFNLNSVNIYGTNSDFTLSNIDRLIADSISSNTIDILSELRTDLIKSYSTSNNIVLDSNVTINEILTAKNNVNIAGDIYTAGNAYVEGDITSASSLISNKALELKEINSENSSCLVNGSLSVTSNGSLLNCVDGKWNSAIKDSTPIGTVAMWTTTSLPSGWIEMNGQSTAPYPKLRSVVGNNVPDLRGQFVRAWDNGRGIDSGRGLNTNQGDAIRNITGNMYYIAETWNVSGSANGAFRKMGGYWGRVTPSRTDDSNSGAVSFDASRVVPTANENRPNNITLMYIIKAQ